MHCALQTLNLDAKSIRLYCTTVYLSSSTLHQSLPCVHHTVPKDDVPRLQQGCISSCSCNAVVTTLQSHKSLQSVSEGCCQACIRPYMRCLLAGAVTKRPAVDRECLACCHAGGMRGASGWGNSAPSQHAFDRFSRSAGDCCDASVRTPLM